MNLPLNGRRRFQGPILGVDSDIIRIEQDGVAVNIAGGNVNKAKLVAEFEEPVKPGKKGQKPKKQ